MAEVRTTSTFRMTGPSLGRKRDGATGAVSAARAWDHRSAQAKRSWASGAKIARPVLCYTVSRCVLQRHASAVSSAIAQQQRAWRHGRN